MTGLETILWGIVRRDVTVTRISNYHGVIVAVKSPYMECPFAASIQTPKLHIRVTTTAQVFAVGMLHVAIAEMLVES